eukprot:9421578-Pyramimonas_sp.AAC.2
MSSPMEAPAVVKLIQSISAVNQRSARASGPPTRAPRGCGSACTASVHRYSKPVQSSRVGRGVTEDQRAV